MEIPASAEDKTTSGVIKHATAGVFVSARSSDGWKLGLVTHPRLGRMTIPGGHVEEDEQFAQAAVREVAEETGLQVRLLPSPTSLPLPAGYPHPAVTPPWWITEGDAVADSHVARAHVHVDHQYVAIVDDPVPVSVPEHDFGWFTEAELTEVEMFDDTRLLATALFGCIDGLAAGRSAEVVAALSQA